MKKHFWIFFVVLVIATLAAEGFIWWHYKKIETNYQKLASPIQTNPNLPTAPTPEIAAQPAPVLVYPISSFSTRTTTNLFGTYYAPGGTSNPDRLVCPNATYYPGYHTAIDLETTADEANQNIAVFAIATGTVRQVSAVSGYGGLLVVQYNLGGSDYTAYYGHVDLSTIKVKKGDTVAVGETLASLGVACSSTNGNVRKHLHFGLHKGTSIVVSGYVATKSELSNWTDPATFLNSLGAVAN